MFRENNHEAQTVVVLCSVFLLTFWYLSSYVKAWLQVLLKMRVPSSGKTGVGGGKAPL